MLVHLPRGAVHISLMMALLHHGARVACVEPAEGEGWGSDVLRARGERVYALLRAAGPVTVVSSHWALQKIWAGREGVTLVCIDDLLQYGASSEPGPSAIGRGGF